MNRKTRIAPSPRVTTAPAPPAPAASLSPAAPFIRSAFSLVEMLIVVVVSLCMLAAYVRAFDEADAADDLMRGDDIVRFARAPHSSAAGPARDVIGLVEAQVAANPPTVGDDAQAVQLQEVGEETIPKTIAPEPAGLGGAAAIDPE